MIERRHHSTRIGLWRLRLVWPNRTARRKRAAGEPADVFIHGRVLLEVGMFTLALEPRRRVHLADE